MSRPWMPLYVGEYLKDTRRLTAAQHGAYLLLIMEYWVMGKLPTDDASLARIACMLPVEWKREKPTIASFFTPDWGHKRIDKEIAKASDISSKRRAAAEQRHSKTDANAEQERSTSIHTRGVIVSSSGDSLELSEPQKEQASGEKRVGSIKFAEFWEIYPHKVGKKDAERAFDKALKTVDFLKLMDGLRRYAAKADDRPWCNPATWLNQGRWDDEPAQVNGANGHAAPAKSETDAEREERQRKLFDIWKRTGKWHGDGPDPDSAACQIPKELRESWTKEQRQ